MTEREQAMCKVGEWLASNIYISRCMRDEQLLTVNQDAPFFDEVYNFVYAEANPPTTSLDGD